MRHRLPLLIVLAGGAGPACASVGVAPRSSASLPAALPSTPLVGLDGDPTDLATVVRGRVALVSLWATWCDACAEEMDALNRLQARASARVDALVVTVAVGETRDSAGAFARRRGLSCVQLVDQDFLLADALGQREVPATLVVDRLGRIVFRGGALDAAGLAAFRAALGVSE